MKRPVLPILLIVLSMPVSGQDRREPTSQAVRIARLSATHSGDRGAFSVSSVETLGKSQFSVGIGWDNYDRTPRDLDVNVMPVWASFGLTRRLTVTGMIEAAKQVTARNLAQPGFFNTLPFVSSRYESGIGDATIKLKYRLVRKADNVGGVSLAGFVKLPSGEPDRGLGTGRVDGGLELGFTSLLPLDFVLHSTTGLVATADAPTRGLKDELRSGIGVAWPATGLRLPGRGAVQTIFEYANVSFIGAGSTNRVIQSPTDVAAGLRYMLPDSGLSVGAAYRRNIRFDDSFRGNREANGFLFGLSYTQPGEPLSLNNFPVAVLQASAETLSTGDTLQITVLAFDADNEELTYAWNSTDGAIEGSGETVTFETAGLAEGDYVVRVVVTDSRGGATRAELTITVR